MTDPPAKPLPRPPGAVRRRAVDASGEALVRSAPLVPGRGLPLVVEPALDGVRLLDWAEDQRGWLDRALLDHGGVLLRGFGLSSLEEFEEVVRRTSGELMTYTFRSTPRTAVAGRVYTSTEYPAHQPIPLHNEMSYTRRWPLRIGFFAQQPATRGGATPIADSRRVYRRIAPEVRARFETHGVLYVRNYSGGGGGGGGLDVPWQEVFQTDDPAEVEAFCREAGIELEWRGGDRLRTRQVCQAVTRHPETGETVWFNQAHLFHVSSLEPEVRRSLLSRLAPEDLPRNAFYGDGSPIGDEELDEVRRAWRDEAVDVAWQAGDLLLLDNVLAAHGRAPYEGPRRVLVAMARPSDGGAEELRG
jgi:alpha-ketoglutarate-dependent taurine dioxygenase